MKQIPVTKETAMRSADNRRYSLKIDNEILDPQEFNEINAYNPRGLKAEAMKVAASVARALDTEVGLVKHLKTGDRDEAYLTPGWNC